MAFSGSGLGTIESPYIIMTTDQLNEIRSNLSSYFLLGQDLDLNIAPYNTGTGWVPIGTKDTAEFTGNFNGNNHKISNLIINLPSQDYVGLFGYISNGATIANLIIENPNIIGCNNVGALYGMAYTNITISNCRVIGSGSIKGNDEIGGLGGNIDTNSSIINSSSTISVTGVNDVGGLVGIASDNITFSKNYAISNVYGNTNIGGLIGKCFTTNINIYPKIDQCYSIGNMTCEKTYLGGIVGYAYYVSIADSFAIGTLIGNIAGGILGCGSGPIQQTYFAGKIYPAYDNSSIDSIISQVRKSLSTSNCYWDSSDNLEGKYGGTGKNTQALTYKSTFVGWDFNNIWTIDESLSYPYLRQIVKPSQVLQFEKSDMDYINRIRILVEDFVPNKCAFSAQNALKIVEHLPTTGEGIVRLLNSIVDSKDREVILVWKYEEVLNKITCAISRGASQILLEYPMPIKYLIPFKNPINWESKATIIVNGIQQEYCSLCGAIDKLYHEIEIEPNQQIKQAKLYFLDENFLINGYNLLPLYEESGVTLYRKDIVYKIQNAYVNNDAFMNEVNKVTGLGTYNPNLQGDPDAATLVHSRWCKKCGSRKPSIYDPTKDLEYYEGRNQFNG